MINIEEILNILPHRYPMLLVDRIIESEPGVQLKGIKNVSINEPFFQGHYPGTPIMPGVLILEAMAQAGAVLMLSDPNYKGWLPLIGAIDNAKFKRPVTPGDQLLLHVELLWLRSSIGKFKGTASVGGEIAATMEMTFKLLKRDGN